MTHKSKQHQIWSHSGGMEKIKEAHRAELCLWGSLASNRQNPRDGTPLIPSPGLRASLALTPRILICQHIEDSCMFQGRSHRH